MHELISAFASEKFNNLFQEGGGSQIKRIDVLVRNFKKDLHKVPRFSLVGVAFYHP